MSLTTRAVGLVSLMALCGCATPILAERSEARVVHRAQVYIEADYDVVWDHFTRANLYGSWSSAPGIEFSTAQGGRVAWGTGDRVVYEGELIQATKGAGLSHTFRFAWLEEDPSVVAIEVVGQGPVTLVSLTHTFDPAPQTAEMIGALGWTKSLSRLKTLLETGRAMPWPVDAAQ